MLVTSGEKPPCRGTRGALRDPGVKGRPDLGLGGRGLVAEGVIFHLTAEGWAGVSSVDGGEAELLGRGPRLQRAREGKGLQRWRN